MVIGTGGKGKIYRLEGDPPRPTLLARASAQQVTAFHKDARGRRTTRPRIRERSSGFSRTDAHRGHHESDVRDAQMVSTWAHQLARHRAGRQPHRDTPGPGIPKPRRHLSAWAGPHVNAEGSPVTSPKARYLQWRCVVTGQGGPGPVLTSVTAAYLQRNLRPVVRSITVHPPGIVFQKPFSTGDPELAGFEDQSTPDRKLAAAASAQPGSSSSLGRRTYQKSLQTLIWKADDENDDDLVTTCSIGAKVRRRGKRCGRRRRKLFSCGTPPPFRTGHIL
jgi:hypothetical protein